MSCGLTRVFLLSVMCVVLWQLPTVTEGLVLDEVDNCLCYSEGLIRNCNCTADSLDRLNNAKIAPILEELLKYDYFKYYQADLHRPCPLLLVQTSQCSSTACTVEKTDSHLINNKQLERRVDSKNPQSFIDRPQLAELQSPSKKFPGIDDYPEFYDLLQNPERFTGYAGASSAFVWKLIYEQSCFRPVTRDDSLRDKYSLHSIMSGLHTSIAVDVTANWQFTGNTTEGREEVVWRPNIDEFNKRFDPVLTNGEGPDRLKNMYLLYLVEIKALSLAADSIQDELYCIGHSFTDRKLQELAAKLFRVLRIYTNHLKEINVFHESRQLVQLCNEQLKNVTSIMDCISCSKCKLWGKLRFAGLSSALNILEQHASSRLSATEIAPKPTRPNLSYHLTQHEISSLLNSFGKLSKSIEDIETFRRLKRHRSTESYPASTV